VDRLKSVRKSKKLTQKELAEKLGVSYSALCSYEQGLREPNIECLKKISKVLDASIDYLVEND
jgi:transcriptional regulator with XRE-family HTH domain